MPQTKFRNALKLVVIAGGIAMATSLASCGTSGGGGSPDPYSPPPSAPRGSFAG